MITREQAATLKLQKELSKRTSQSIFDRSGNLDIRRANELSEGYIGLGEYLHLDTVPWASEPFGSEHCQHLSRLVEYMAQLPESWGGVVGGPLDKHDQKVLHAVAMLYATGKKHGLEGYEARSAAIADQYFRQGGGSGTYWSKSEVREDVCRLLYSHNRREDIETDKRLQVFSDALRYEMTRLEPNTARGMAVLKEFCRPESFYMGWSKDRANLRAYMVSRGWR